jgi:hypothetical protein
LWVEATADVPAARRKGTTSHASESVWTRASLEFQ